MLNQSSRQTFPSGPSPSSRDIPPTQQRNLHATVDELLSWTSELENHLDRLRTTLIGSTPNEGVKGMPVEMMSVDDKVSNACTRIASLCGLARTILNGVEGE
jgi:hypothetical protein